MWSIPKLFDFMFSIGFARVTIKIRYISKVIMNNTGNFQI